MKKLNQNGFSAFEIILLVLVVALIGFAGYTVYEKNKPIDNQSNNTVNTNGNKTSSQVKTADPNNGYLVVKEWGVKFKLEDSNKDVKYYIAEPGSQSMTLSTPRLDQLAKETPVCLDAHKSISLNRSKVGDDRFGSPWTERQLSEIGTKLGDHFYYLEGGQPCFFPDTESENKYKANATEIGTIRAKFNGIHKTVIAL